MIRKSLPLLLLWILATASVTWSQANIKALESQAAARFEALDYQSAFELCSIILHKEPKNVEAHVYRGAVYAIGHDFKLANEDLHFALDHRTRNPYAYAYQGYILQRQKHYPEALEAFEKAIALDSKCARAYQMRGTCYIVMGKADLAVQQFKKQAQLEPTSGFSFLNLGLGYFAIGDTAETIASFQRALELKAADSAFAYQYLGIVAFQQDQKQLGESYFKKSVAINPRQAESWIFLFALKFLEQDFQAALPMAEQAIRAAPNDPEGYYSKGNCLLMMQRPLEAIPLYSLCIGMGGDSLSIYYLGRAQARSLVHQTIDAIKDFDKSIALDPSKPNGYALRGLNYAELGDYERALADLKKAQQLNPHSPWILLHVAGLQVTLGQIEEGTKGLLDYAAMEPTDPMVWLQLGTVSQREKQYAKAIDYLTKSIELGITDSIQAFGSRAECYAKTGRLADADTDMKLMLTIKTDDPKQLSTIGYYLNLHGKYEEALWLCDSSIALDPTFAFAYNNRGFAKYKLGMYASAIEDFDKSIALKNVYYHWPPHNRGNCKRALGQYQEAIADYNLSLSYQPDFVEALTDRGETWEKLEEPEKALADYRLALKYQADYKPALENLKRLGE